MSAAFGPVFAAWILCGSQPTSAFPVLRLQRASTRLGVSSTSPSSQNADFSEEPVRVFGANFDRDLAGSNAVHMPELLADEVVDIASDDGVATLYFAEGVGAMKKGSYDAAVALFRRATAYAGGSRTRRGGQMQLWLCQALYASGEVAEAAALARKLSKEGSGNIKKAAKSLYLIFEAPPIKGVGNKVNFPPNMGMSETLRNSLNIEKVEKNNKVQYRTIARSWKKTEKGEEGPKAPVALSAVQAAMKERDETLAILMPALLLGAALFVYGHLVL